MFEMSGWVGERVGGAEEVRGMSVAFVERGEEEGSGWGQAEGEQCEGGGDHR